MPSFLARRGELGARVWVHVIHFPFKDKGELTRTFNSKDLDQLRTTFDVYSTCCFRDQESPNVDKIIKSLQSDGMRTLFSHGEGPPDVYILIVLSHGQENGVILTDTSNEEFTTTQLTQELSRNAFLENTLKVIFFGPCKGSGQEKMLPYKGAHAVPPISSTRILAGLTERNFAIFYSTMESMVAVVESNGSWMVSALCETLNSLKYDAHTLELFRLVSDRVCAKWCVSDCQMPQCYVYPHDPNIFFCKRSSNTGSDARGDSSRVPAAGKEDFFAWQSEDVEYNRGLALVFGASKTDAENLSVTLDALKYQTEVQDIVTISETLENISSNGMVRRMGSLLVVVIAKLVISDGRLPGQQEWLIDVGRAQIPIGNLLTRFVGTSCPTFAAKPKLFFFLDSGLGAEISGRDVPTTRDAAVAHNHENFLVLTTFDDGAISKLIAALGGRREEQISSLQDALLPFIDSSSTSNVVNLLWSTMTKLVDFPKEVDIYSPHCLVEDVSRKRHSLEDFVKQQSKMELNGRSLLVRVHGLGQTRFAEELHSRLVVNVKAFVILARLDNYHEFWSGSPSVESILRQFKANRQKEFDPQHERLFVIADGWSNLPTHQRNIIIGCLKSFVESTPVQLFVTLDPRDKTEFVLENCRTEGFELDISECCTKIKNTLRSRYDKKLKRIEYEASTAAVGSRDYFPQSFTVSRVSSQDSVPEEEVVDLEEVAHCIAQSSNGTIFLLVSPAGMGKSKCLLDLQDRLQRKLGDFKIIRVNLQASDGALEDFADEPKHPDSVCEFLEKATMSRVEKDKVKDGRVIVLLDAFDEVSLRYRDVLLELLILLKGMQFKSLVATRPQEERFVARALALADDSIFKLNPICRDQQPKFVASVWRDPSKKDLARELLRSVAPSECSPAITEFWGSPHNLQVLAKMCRSGRLDENIKAADVYRLVIEKGINDTVKVCNSNDQNRTREQDKQDFIAGLKRVQEMAVDHVLKRNAITASEEDKKLNIDKYAFFVLDNETNELRFTHQTYADFLVAVWIVGQQDADKEKCFLDYESEIASTDIPFFVEMIMSSA